MFLPLFFKHPLTKKKPLEAISRYCKWHSLKLINKAQMTHTLIGNTKINLGKNDSAALVNYYTGLYEFEEMCFLLHFLRKGDLFIDAGANIGVFSLLASGNVGCKSLAFEPIPSTFDSLKKNIELNALENKINIYNIGLGASSGVLRFTNNLESSINRVADKNDKNVIEVNIKTLDSIMSETNNYESILLKVDVEGFEKEVMKGAKDLLRNPLLKAIIIELNGSGKKFGFDEEEIKENLKNEGFVLFSYEPFTRSFTKESTVSSWGNAIYMRDLNFLKSRVNSANSVEVLGETI